MDHAPLAPCPGCGGHFPDVAGPAHPYMESSPGCWAAFGAVLARAYGDPALADVHRLSVDAYAAQHPGQPAPRSMKSVGVHLIRLCLTVEQGYDVREANRIMVAISKVKHRFGWLARPASLGEITVAHVADAATAEAYRASVRAWAACVWQAWSDHHATVRTWAADLPIRTAPARRMPPTS